MTQSLEVQEQNALKCAELLSKLVGITVLTKNVQYSNGETPISKSYQIMKISTIEIQYHPTICVYITFFDGHVQLITEMSQFDELIGKVGDYGSIYEYLIDNNFNLFE